MAHQDPAPSLDVLREIEQRILWLAVRIVDHANRERPTQGGVKVGGHQASSASMVSIMTALWFGHLATDDKVAVKPHASPVFHAIKYLTGELDASWLTRLRELGGLQAYPSRTKDPDVADYSTGSVGLGAVAPLFDAAVHRYLRAHTELDTDPRFIALLGDAELDEGNVWEAIADPALAGLGNVMLVVDLNRQSLDRIVPGIRVRQLEEFFHNAGWHVAQAKYGRRLTGAFARPGGEALRAHIDDMPNERYQSTFRLAGVELRTAFCEGADAAVVDLLDEVPDDALAPLVHDLGGHDLGVLLDTYRACDAERERPSVVFAYTIKGWQLPNQGDPLNHAALLSGDQIDELRTTVGLRAEDEWERFADDSAAAEMCRSVGGEINNPAPEPRPLLSVPTELGGAGAKRTQSTQEAFGRLLVRAGDHPEIADRLVTTSPDVSVSTNLGGWINKRGVFSPVETPDYGDDSAMLRWRPGPTGQHIELGISEMNLFLLLGQLGLSFDHHDELLLPIGTVYDPFVLRGLDALIYGIYNASRFIVVGTPSGVTLAPEGGAHQSTVTASVGMELPGITFAEPAFARTLDWYLCDALAELCRPDGTSTYLRLTTRPVDQTPLAELVEARGEDAVRSDALAGGYVLREPPQGRPAEVLLAGSGAVVPELLAAAERLGEEELPAAVVVLSSADRLHAGWVGELRRRGADRHHRPTTPHVETLLGVGVERAPIVTVHDAASHALSWLGSVRGQPVVPIGVDEFGQSGTVEDLYGLFGLLPDQIVNAALVATGR
ncbi:MAG: 1-deoxy-D-xylulose-5-phosphate synthase N-terminal domain-containing protein [Actinomycetota bacterium]